MCSTDSSFDNIRHLFHRAHVYLPRVLTIVLRVEPSLLASIVQAYNHSYETAVNGDSKLDYDDLILADVLFTKGIYALLKQTPLPPPLWSILEEGQRPEHELGQRLVRGVEILMDIAKEHINNPLSTPSLEDLEEQPEWQKYVASLEVNGFIEGATKGTSSYQEKIEKAYEYYVINLHDFKHRQFVIAGTTLLDIIEELKDRNSEWKHSDETIMPFDSDDWMYEQNGEVKYVYRREDVIGGTPAPMRARKKSSLRKISSDVYRKVSLAGVSGDSCRQRKVSNISLISSLSRKISDEIGCFSDEYRGILDLYIPEDDFASDDDSEMNAYGSELVYKVAQRHNQPVVRETDNKDEFEDVEDFQPVSFDSQNVTNNMEKYTKEHGITDRGTGIFGRLRAVLAERKRV